MIEQSNSVKIDDALAGVKKIFIDSVSSHFDHRSQQESRICLL